MPLEIAPQPMVRDAGAYSNNYINFLGPNNLPWDNSATPILDKIRDWLDQVGETPFGQWIENEMPDPHDVMDFYNVMPDVDHNGQNPDLPIVPIGDLIKEPIDHSGSSAKDNEEVRSIVDEYLNAYKQTGDTAWLEKYLDALLARENTASARAYETEMSNTSFSRALADIKSAGYNPWLMLQNGGSAASTPNVAAAGTSSVSYSAQKTSKENQMSQNMTDIISRIVSAVGIAAAVLIRASLGG